MAKVLLSFMNGLENHGPAEVPCFYEAFIRGLSSNGNEVLAVHRFFGSRFDDKSTEAMQLAESVKRFSPDVVIAFNNFGPDYAKFLDCPILVYEVDSPLYYCNLDAIRARPDRYRYLVVQEESVSVLAARFSVPKTCARVAPFFSEILAQPVEKTINISFIGSSFMGEGLHWKDFRFANPSVRAARLYGELLRDVRNNPFADPSALVNKYNSLGLSPADIGEIIRSLSAEHRILTLSAISDLGLKLFGTTDWLSAIQSNSDLYCAYDPRRLFSLKQNQDLYNASKICLNVNHLQARSGFSWRVCDIMASSGCLVAEYKDNLTRYFPDVPIPTFTNRFEAREQCLRILREDHLREDIVTASQMAIDRGFRFRHILPIIEDAAGVPLAGEGDGAVEFLQLDVAPRQRTVRLIKKLPVRQAKEGLRCMVAFSKQKQQKQMKKMEHNARKYLEHAAFADESSRYWQLSCGDVPC